MRDMAMKYRRRPISIDEYHRMAAAGIFAPDERVELIDGLLIAAPPMGGRYAGAVGELTRLLTRRFSARALVRVQLPVVIEPQSEPEPDIALVPLASGRWLDRHPVAADVLLLIEVAESSRDFDLRQKAAVYARALVREVWVADLVERRLVVHRDPRPSGYALTSVLRPGKRLAPLAFPDDAIDVSTVIVV